MWKKLREKQRNRQECTTAAAVVRILGGKFLEVHNDPKPPHKNAKAPGRHEATRTHEMI